MVTNAVWIVYNVLWNLTTPHFCLLLSRIYSPGFAGLTVYRPPALYHPAFTAHTQREREREGGREREREGEREREREREREKGEREREILLTRVME